MRGTLHLVPAEDARWLVALLGPVGLARGRRRREQMGIGPRRRPPSGAALADGPAPATRSPTTCALPATGSRTTRRRPSTS